MLSRTQRSTQRGLSLVETMVGVALGLFVVAGATVVVGSQLGDTRRLVTETQVQQDLRATADVIVREMRRAGFTSAALGYVWGDGAGDSERNQRSTISASSGIATFEYDRGVNDDGPFGFKLQNNAVYIQVDAGVWQELTDSRVMKVNYLTIAENLISSSQLPCPKNCVDGTTACWPTVTVREYVVTIEGESKADPSVKRTVRSTTRVRNDRVNYNIAGAPDALCPA